MNDKMATPQNPIAQAAPQERIDVVELTDEMLGMVSGGQLHVQNVTTFDRNTANIFCLD